MKRSDEPRFVVGLARAAGLGLAVLVVSSACGGNHREARTVATEPVSVPDGPLSMPDPSDHLLQDARQVSAGSQHTCALSANGDVWCWGRNHVGQLGNGARQDRSEPVAVRGLPPARWVSAGHDSTCAVTLDDEVFCWGANAVGQLGDGEVATGTATPVRTRLDEATTLAGSNIAARHCGIRADGSAACWGQLASLARGHRRVLASETPVAVGGDRRFVQVGVGAHHECLLRDDGRVACRGVPTAGQLGHRPEQRQIEEELVLVPGLTDAVSLAVGGYHTCALQHDGDVFCWGANDRGQLGTGEVSRTEQPRLADLEVEVRDLVAGVAHTCALSTEGRVYCWGANGQGQLGEGTTRELGRATPVPLDRTAIQLAAGASHTCALLSGGRIECWGDNGGGQLGDGTFGDRTWPVSVLDGPEPGETTPQLLYPPDYRPEAGPR